MYSFLTKFRKQELREVYTFPQDLNGLREERNAKTMVQIGL
jgi:hypothetical protein